MNTCCKIKDIGLMDYTDVWDYQELVHKKIVDEKENFSAKNYGQLVLCEHPHVYTLGNSGENKNLLINEQFLKNIDAKFIKTNRGGDITYHGPGQIVGYPILDLNKLNIGVKKYIYLLEEVIIKTLEKFQILASRFEKSTGVWVMKNNKAPVKICAIGVRVSKLVTMHGFALNVCTDLKYFNYINPCGFIDKGVTSIEKEKGSKVEIDKVKKILIDEFLNVFI